MIILTTLELIRQKLNEFFRIADPIRIEDWVILSNITDQEGHAYEQAKNKIVMLLVNIQHETTISTNQPTSIESPNMIAPPLYIDLFILFLANFYDKNYPDGLSAISRTISFFQQHPVFTPEALPGLDPLINKLTFEIVNLDLVELNYLMGMIGAKYLPSVYFKVRVIPFSSEVMHGVDAAQGVEAVERVRDQQADNS